MSRRSTYLATTSTSRLTRSPGCLAPERRDRERVRDHRDVERPSSSSTRGDGEADAVDGDRALLDDVAQRASARRGERSCGSSRRAAARRVDDARRRRRRGPARCGRRAGRRGAPAARGSPGRRRASAPSAVRSRVSVTASAAHQPSPQLDDGEAAAVHRDRRADLGVVEHARGGDLDARAARVRGDARARCRAPRRCR